MVDAEDVEEVSEGDYVRLCRDCKKNAAKVTLQLFSYLYNYLSGRNRRTRHGEQHGQRLHSAQTVRIELARGSTHQARPCYPGCELTLLSLIAVSLQTICFLETQARTKTGMRQAKGSVMLKPMPINETISHVMETLPSMDNIVISVKTKSGFDKETLVDMSKV